ncbi:hypothetical protein KPL71_026519 [Citrus sinensis]|uniref:Uncharacterized protein n=1 Tax=Citrus sinensis TaxID=2711 RepID=A0ACB8HZT2_CITSI|nr:hypothetical protein KPL71_026519 [Citrus sinensis]
MATKELKQIWNSAVAVDIAVAIIAVAIIAVAVAFDPEIERTARRLRREHRELQAAVAMDDLQDLRNLNRREGIQPVNVHEGLNGQCVQRQPGNNNIIHMANDRDRMLQTVGQFNGLPSEDPHLHLKLFLEVSDAFKIAGASQEALRLRLFSFSLRDRARAWLNSLPPDSITTWSDLANKFLLKYFPPTKNAKLRNEITSFHQLEDESLCDAWERFEELLRSFNRQNQDNPYSNTHNPGWRQYPNFSWSYQNQTAVTPSVQNKHAQPPGFYQQNQEQRSINNDQLSSLRGLIKDYIVRNETVVQSHTVSLRNLKNQIGQLATALSNIPQGSLPASAESYDPAPGGEEATAPTATYLSRAKEKQSAQPAVAQQFRHPPPFPQRFQKQQQGKQFSKILGVLKQLHINIPFVKSKIPQKIKDPGSFTIPCSIGTKYSGKALCDLGASINLMPLSVFKSHAYPEGKIEDVLVKVDKFIFPVDFIVLDFETEKDVPIILGRPFLATGKTLIDVQKGELTMRVNDQQVTFNVLDAMKSPDDIEDYRGAANITWLGEKQPFKIDEQIQQRELTPEQQEFKVNGPKVKHYMRDDVNSLKTDMFLKDPG